MSPPAGLVAAAIPDAVAFSERSRVYLGRTMDGTPVDIAMSGIEYEMRMLDRASRFDFGGAVLTTCSAEDLVVMKVFAGRDQDWIDVEAVALRRGGTLDWGLVERELRPLLAVKDDRAALERLESIRKARG